MKDNIPAIFSSCSNKSERILVFIPAYNCAKQIVRVLAQIRGLEQYFTEVLVVDNRSLDDTVSVACEAAQKLALPVTVVKNEDNYGLGGSHKVAFQYAIDQRFDYCIVLHGDDQGCIRDLVPYLESKTHHHVDCLLGARFMSGANLEGYSTFRTFGNKIFNLLFSFVARKRLYDLGSGLNLYRVSKLASSQWGGFANNLAFNYFMILATIHWGWKIHFFPITWREDDQTSNVKIIRQSMQILSILGRFTFRRSMFLNMNHSGRPLDNYRYSLIKRTHTEGNVG